MYYSVTRTDELQHHGIKGQKWGVRRYQNPDGSLTAAGRNKYYKSAMAIGFSERSRRANLRAAKRTSGVGQRMAINKATRLQYRADVREDVKNAKGLGAKLHTSRFGNEGMARRLSAMSEAAERKVDTRKTTLGKMMSEQFEKNTESAAKVYQKVADTKGLGKKIVTNMSETWNMDYTRLSGRTTTLGKHTIDNLVTGGIVGAAKDIRTIHNTDYKKKYSEAHYK